MKQKRILGSIFTGISWGARLEVLIVTTSLFTDYSPQCSPETSPVVSLCLGATPRTEIKLIPYRLHAVSGIARGKSGPTDLARRHIRLSHSCIHGDSGSRRGMVQHHKPRRSLRALTTSTLLHRSVASPLHQGFSCKGARWTNKWNSTREARLASVPPVVNHRKGSCWRERPFFREDLDIAHEATRIFLGLQRGLKSEQNGCFIVSTINPGN